MRRPDAVDGHGLQGDARSLAICRDASERRGEAHALLWLGRVELQADDSRAARHWLGHLLFTFRDFQMREELAQCLEDHAQLAFLDGRLDSAVLLAGAAHAYRGRHDLRPSPFDQRQWNARLSRMREALPEPAFDASWARGGAMELDDVIAAAMDR